MSRYDVVDANLIDGETVLTAFPSDRSKRSADELKLAASPGTIDKILANAGARLERTFRSDELAKAPHQLDVHG